MRKIKIVADSSANITALNDVDFSPAPLKVIAGDTEFVDDASLVLDDMLEFFEGYKGKSQTSCPSPADWLDAFSDADEVFCVTITSGLSGSYNSACVAQGMAKDKKVHVVDSLSAGPELRLIVEKLVELIKADMEFEQICKEIEEYKKTTGLVFMLESLKNFAANGRISPAIAKITGFLGIRIVGKASDQGTLQPLNKCRGEANSLKTILSHLKENGVNKGKVRISHCQNEGAAARLTDMIKAELPSVDVDTDVCRGLCSYYAEKGGLLVGYEKF